MPFGTVIGLFVLFVLFPAVLLNGLAAMKKAKAGEASKGGDLRASELRRMIADAVEAATAGLAARITDLEERLGDEPVSALRERVGGGQTGGPQAGRPQIGGPALSAAFDRSSDPEADLDDADGLPVQRRARA